MAIDKLDKSFKILINKEFTTDNKEFYQEVGSDTLNIHSREVWVSPISENSASAILSGVATYYNQFILTPDPSALTNAFFFMSGSGFTPGTSPFDRNFKLDNFISDKYGDDYEVKLYANDGTRIYKANEIHWIFDYKTGILHISDPGSYPTPYRISVFRYIGQTLSSTGGEGYWTGSAAGTISRNSDIVVSGSAFISGNIEIIDGGMIDGVDISDFSQSVAYQINNLETGSSKWSILGDGSISRNSDVKITGSLEITGNVDGVDVNNFSSSIETRITDNETDIIDLQTDSSSFSTRITSNEITSSNLQIASSSFSTRVTDNETDIIDLQTDSSSFSTRVTSNETNITNLQTDSSSFETRVTDNETNITNLQTDSGSFETRITNIVDNGVDYAKTASVLLGNVESASYADFALTASYAESSNITDFSSSVETRITNNETDIDNLQTDSASLGDRITINKTDINDLQTDSGSFSIRVTDNETDIDNLQIDSSSFSTRITDNETDITNLQTNSSSFSTRITNNEDTGSDHETRIDALEVYSGSYWTGSNGVITRESDIQITGSMFISGNIDIINSGTVDGVDISDFSESVAYQINNLETGSSKWSILGDGSISRNSNVKITGSLEITGTVDGVDVNNFSSSIEIRITDNETDIIDLQTDSSSFSTRITDNEINIQTNSSSFETRVTDNEITSSNLQIASSSFSTRVTTDETNIINLQTDSGSFEERITKNEVTGSDQETRIDALENYSGSYSGSYWTGSNGIIIRESDVQITGSLSVTDSTRFGNSLDDNHIFTGSFQQTGSGTTSYFMDKLVVGKTGSDYTFEVKGDTNAESINVAGNNIITSIPHSGRMENFAGNNGLGQSKPVYFNISQSEAIIGTRTSDTVFTRASGEWTGSALVGQYVYSYTGSLYNTGSWDKIIANTTTTLTINETLYVDADSIKTSVWCPIDAEYLHGKFNNSFRGGVFDGESIWLIPFNSDDLIKVDPSTGEMVFYAHGKGIDAFFGGIFDGQNIWLVPYNSNALVKVDSFTGEMTSYSHGKGTNAFCGGVFDGQNIWLVPYNSDDLVKVNPSTGEMTSYSHGKGNEVFTGGIFDGQNIWLVPLTSDSLIKVDPSTGEMVSYIHGKGSFAFWGGLFDGQNVWLIPYNSDNLVKVNPSTGEMISYTHGKGNLAFAGGVFDGENIWLVPYASDDLVKVNPQTGEMVSYAHGKDDYAFFGGVFDGQNVWLISHSSNFLVKLVPPRTGLNRKLINQGRSDITFGAGLTPTKVMEINESGVEITGSLNITGTVDGVDIGNFSSSIETRITDTEIDIQTNSSSFSTRITDNKTNITNLQTDSSSFSTRVTNNEITGSNLQINSGSFSTRITDNETDIDNLQTDSGSFGDRVTDNETDIDNLQTDSSSFEIRVTNNEGTGSDHETRIDGLENYGGSYWTGSNGIIIRESDIQITGSLFISGNIEMTGSYTVDGVDISDFSQSVAYQINNLETGSSKWSILGDGSISRNSDVKITGSMFISGNIDIINSGTVDGVDISEFSESVASKINSMVSGSYWTASDGFITRESNVQITGSLFVSGTGSFGLIDGGNF